MADEPETTEPSAGADESSSSPAEKPARSRGRAAPAEGGADAGGVEKPKRTRAAAKPADAEAVSEQAPKPRRARAAAKKAQEEPSGAEAPKPRRARAAAKAADEEVVAEEAPKPRRTRARAGKPEEGTVEAPAPLPAPKPARAAAKPPRTRAGVLRGRRAQPLAGQPPLVHAKARYVRSSARKARIVCDHIRGKSVPEARAILAFAPRGVAKDWAKLLDSAVANAEHNHELIGDELRIKEVFADVGPTLKRFRPRAMGRATPINKRTAHLSITLTPKE
jgi:ribosomal protein L22